MIDQSEPSIQDQSEASIPAEYAEVSALTNQNIILNQTGSIHHQVNQLAQLGRRVALDQHLSNTSLFSYTEDIDNKNIYFCVIL